MIEGFQFEVSKVDTMEIRERMVWQLAHVDSTLSRKVAEGIGVNPLADATVQKIQSEVKALVDRIWNGKERVMKSAFLSQESLKKDTIIGRKIAVLAAEGASTE